MSLRFRLPTLAAACLALSPCPALAQDADPDPDPAATPAMVSAVDLPGVAEVLRTAGYEIEIHARSEAGALARIEIVDGEDIATLIFNDCNEAIPDFCETIVLSTWWDRTLPISDEALAAANRNLRYVSVFCDKDGDPEMQWAILTRREGVPATVLLDALKRFLDVAREFGEFAFDGDEPAVEGSSDDTDPEAGTAVTEPGETAS